MEWIQCYQEETSDTDKDLLVHHRQSQDNPSLPSAKKVLLKGDLVGPVGKLGLFPTLVFVGLARETCEELAAFGSQLINQSQTWFDKEESVWKISFYLEQLQQLNSSSTRVSCPNALPPHISLSRTVFLGDMYTESFIQTLRRLTRIHYFQLKDDVQRLQLFQNDENNTSFLGLLLEQGKNLVQDWILQVDKVMQTFRLPIFYSPAVPHVTFAKSSQQEWSREVVAKLQKLIPTQPIQIRVQGLYCLIGCKIYFIY
ncbi:hypothetical protein GpartN1_g4516.t1 [Galdieria partita]|uniref:U6 snRNA phosphodiesterase 1 n=1 Tax=Galdieria partita TaxID=83374 RepID=A0A9C7PYG0_9RHOD|nr:hypothetical protein GpartN1_g4516.t1 [Galdieria partita]